MTPWSKAEDELILELHSEYGNSWDLISVAVTALGGSERFPVQCRKRYNVLRNPAKEKKENVVDLSSLVRKCATSIKASVFDFFPEDKGEGRDFFSLY